jgi:Ankyrin repeats (3 copies)
LQFLISDFLPDVYTLFASSCRRQTSMLTPKAKHIRFTTWAVMALEVGALLFAAGLVSLYLNPFWHFDEGGFLDWRVHWWNTAGESLASAGLLIEAVALVASVAVLVSRSAGRKSWPYLAAGLLVFGVLVWVATEGFVNTLNAHFEWNAADGFTVFRVLPPERPTASFLSPLDALWQSIIEIQIQPLLRGYFKVNDWQKMNGDLGITVVRVVPIAWPIGLGSGGETLEDPDETVLMRAAEQQDLSTLQQLLSASTRSDVNALDQGGQTALILACRNPRANPAVVRALLAAGADVNLRARNGYAPLTWALARNNGEVVRILRRAGGKP